MKYIIRKVLLLLVITSVTPTLLASEKMYIAIVDFEVTADLEFENPGKAIARMMINPLKETGKFRLFERVLLRKILDEQILSTSDYVDDKKRASKVGKIFGVKGLITGSVVRWGDSIIVVVQLLDVSTGEILRNAEVRVRNVNLIPERLNEVASIISGFTSNSTLKKETSNFQNNNIQGRYPEASLRYLTGEDIQNLTSWDLSIMRNELFARHGYIFKSEDMKKHFTNQTWYRPINENADEIYTLLSDIEKGNIELIKKYEQ